jgi:hypothetical protein
VEADLSIWKDPTTCIICLHMATTTGSVGDGKRWERASERVRGVRWRWIGGKQQQNAKGKTRGRHEKNEKISRTFNIQSHNRTRTRTHKRTDNRSGRRATWGPDERPLRRRERRGQQQQQQQQQQPAAHPGGFDSPCTPHRTAPHA